MKHILFGISLVFAAMFLMSTLVGFIWNLIALTNGTNHSTAAASWSYWATGIGIFGWIFSTLALVIVDEEDGENFDEGED